MMYLFICYYLAAMKVCHDQLYKLYCDPLKVFTLDAFHEFTDLMACRHTTILTMVWVALYGFELEHISHMRQFHDP